MATLQTDTSKPGQKIEPVVHASTEIAQLQEFNQILLGMAETPAIEEDPDEVSRKIVMQLLSASSDDELTIGTAIGWKELLDIPIDIQGFRWRKSDFEEGAPVYVLVAGVRCDTGEYLPAITTGSYNVMAQLSNLAQRGQLPGAVWQLTESTKQTAAGFKPLWLTKTPDEVVETYRTMVGDGSNPLDEPEPPAA